MELCTNLLRGNERGSTGFWLGVKVEDLDGRHLRIGGLGGGGF
jgi:hypothetical protein